MRHLPPQALAEATQLLPHQRYQSNAGRCLAARSPPHAPGRLPVRERTSKRCIAVDAMASHQRLLRSPSSTREPDEVVGAFSSCSDRWRARRRADSGRRGATGCRAPSGAHCQGARSRVRLPRPWKRHCSAIWLARAPRRGATLLIAGQHQRLEASSSNCGACGCKTVSAGSAGPARRCRSGLAPRRAAAQVGSACVG